MEPPAGLPLGHHRKGTDNMVAVFDVIVGVVSDRRSWGDEPFGGIPEVHVPSRPFGSSIREVEALGVSLDIQGERCRGV